MDCREARDLLNEELDGRLAPESAARLAGHVASCSACAQERRDLAALRATFRAMPCVAAPPGFKDGVMAALPRGRLRTFPRVAGWIAAVAAVAVLTVTLLPDTTSVVERDVAFARKNSPRAGRDEAGAPAPVFEGKGAERSDPPPPAALPESRPDDLGHSSPKEPSQEAGGEARSRDGLAKTAEEEAERAPAPPAPTTPPPGRAAQPPAPSPKPGAAAEGAAAAAAGPELLHLEAAEVRYVVFSDAVAAQTFADELSAADESRAKEKSKDKSKGDEAVKDLAQDADLDAKKVKREDASELLKAAAFRSRRVISRTTLAAALAGPDLATRAAAAGGALVPEPDAARFAELLDAPAPKNEQEKSKPAADPGERKAAPADVATAGGKAGARRAAPSVVIVIVVLEDPAKPPGEKR